VASIAGRPAGRSQRARVRTGKLPALEHEDSASHRNRARRTEVPVVAEAPVEPLHQQDEWLPADNPLLDLPVGGPADEVDQPVPGPCGPPGDELTDGTDIHEGLGDDSAGEPGADLTPVPSPDASPHQTVVLLRARRNDEHERPIHPIHLEVSADGGEPHP
jgi:hypothetical protein